MSEPSTLPDQRSTTSCFADHADENGFILSTTDLLLAGASATQILTKIEKQNLLGDADVFRFGEKSRLRQGYGAAGSALLASEFIERYKHS